MTNPENNNLQAPFIMSFCNPLSLINRSHRNAESPSSTEHAASVKPVYQIQDGAEAWGLVVQLPGVTKEGLEFTADQGQIRIVGRRAWKTPEGWNSLYRETENVPFELVISHDNVVDIEKVHAELRDGFLRASLPKAPALMPRKVAVN